MADADPRRRSAGTRLDRRAPLPWPADREFRILSIDGGGIRGILPACFLAALEERYLGNGNVADCFDLIAGTSTGGILALGLAAGLTARQLRELYMERGREIFPAYPPLERLIASFRHVLFTRCDRVALDRMIDGTLGDRQLWQASRRLCIPSLDATFGDVFIFKTPHHPDFKKDWKEPMAKAAKATSAAPSFFKPVSDDTYTYLDGGIWANNPIMIALVDALTAFDISRDKVRILTLGCVESTYAMRWYHKRLGGAWLWASNVINGAMHFQSLNALGQAGLLIGRNNMLRVNYPPIRPKLELHDWVSCSAILPEKAAELLGQFGEQAALMFLHSLAEPYWPIYTPTNPPS